MSKYQISCSLFFPLFLLILLEEADDKEDDTEEEGDEEDDEMEVEARGSEGEESWYRWSEEGSLYRSDVSLGTLKPRFNGSAFNETPPITCFGVFNLFVFISYIGYNKISLITNIIFWSPKIGSSGT